MSSLVITEPPAHVEEPEPCAGSKPISTPFLGWGETASLEAHELELEAGNSKKIEVMLTRKKGISIGKRSVLVLVTPEADPKTMCN